jgi:uncharacterized Zn finger protein (UPF0148 family)
MKINCPNKGCTIELSEPEYERYKGEIKCPTCQALLEIETETKLGEVIPRLLSCKIKEGGQ